MNGVKTMKTNKMIFMVVCFLFTYIASVTFAQGNIGRTVENNMISNDLNTSTISNPIVIRYHSTVNGIELPFEVVETYIDENIVNSSCSINKTFFNLTIVEPYFGIMIYSQVLNYHDIENDHDGKKGLDIGLPIVKIQFINYLDYIIAINITRNNANNVITLGPTMRAYANMLFGRYNATISCAENGTLLEKRLLILSATNKSFNVVFGDAPKSIPTPIVVKEEIPISEIIIGCIILCTIIATTCALFSSNSSHHHHHHQERRFR